MALALEQRQFKFEVQRVVMMEGRVLREEFDSQAIFWVYG